MKSKKYAAQKMHLNKKMVLVVSILILLLSLFNLFTAISLTGAASVGTVGICISVPSTLNAITSQSVEHNSLFTLQVNASVTGNATLSYECNTSFLNINSSTGLINFTPNISRVGNYSVRITINDNNSECPGTATTAFNLSIYNLAPALMNTITIPNQSWEMNVWLTGIAMSSYFYDPENDSLSYSALHGNNVEVTINSSNVATIYPDPEWTGVSWVIFTANDTLSTGNSNNITLTVGDVALPSIVLFAPNVTEFRSTLRTTLKVSVSEIGTIKYKLDNLSNITACSLCSGAIKNITLPSFGRHNLTIYAEDLNGNLNSYVFNFTVHLDTDGDGIPDVNETDSDNDGISDADDFLAGNASNIYSNFVSLNVSVNYSANLSQIFGGQMLVNISNGTSEIVEFNFNFSNSSKMRLGDIYLEKENLSAVRGSLIVRGINLSDGNTKIMYVDRINQSNNVCLKDSIVNDITEISSTCNVSNEYNLTCPSTLGNYTCSVYPRLYKITGVSHSAAIELLSGPAAAEPIIIYLPGGGGGGGGSTYKVIETILGPARNATCALQTECTGWSPASCISAASQKNTCISVEKDCKVVQRIEERACICAPQWTCSIWSDCTEKGIKTRACVDVNSCGTSLLFPLEQDCVYSSEASSPKTGLRGLNLGNITNNVGMAIKTGVNKSINYGMHWIVLGLIVLLTTFFIYLARKDRHPILINEKVIPIETNDVCVDTVVTINKLGKPKIWEGVRTSRERDFNYMRRVK